MVKKRKAGRSGAGVSKVPSSEDETVRTARYDQDETFADSQDEFFAGKDQIMVEEGPSRKRRKQIEEEGMNTPNVFGLSLTKPKITT
jgi:U3 small nucleolar RNA-associated protein 3